MRVYHVPCLNLSQHAPMNIRLAARPDVRFSRFPRFRSTARPGDGQPVRLEKVEIEERYGVRIYLREDEYGNPYYMTRSAIASHDPHEL